MKEKYLEYLKSIALILARNNFSNEIKQELINLEKEIENFKLKVPLVGGFSAGKSSLINTYLGCNILSEEITPETAIATEIKYGPNVIKAHSSNGNCETYNLDYIKNLKTDDLDYIEVFCENSNIKNLDDDIVIVDMPGFDSRLENHNKAILKYLNNGVAFILVIDCEDGCMKSSLITFLHELSSYQLNFSVIINKSDKKTKADLEDIVNNVKDTINSISENIIVETASKFEDDTQEKISKILKNFDKELIFKKCFKDRMLTICSRVENSLNSILNNSEVDLEEINKKILSIKNMLEDLDYKVREEQINLNNKIDGCTTKSILKDVKEILFNNSSNLANALIQGKAVFSNQLNDLIRPVLINVTSANLEPVFSNIIKNIEFELTGLDDIVQGIPGKLAKTTLDIDSIDSNIDKLKKTSELFKSFDKYYKLATGGLAIVTNFVAPWIELIILFLPDIFKIFSGKSKQENAKNSIENEIIPQIIDKLRPDVSKSLNTVKAEFMNDLIKSINSKKIDLQNSLDESIKMKEMKKEDFDAKITKIKYDHNIVCEILKEL